jgi:hypothetical protein
MTTFRELFTSRKKGNIFNHEGIPIVFNDNKILRELFGELENNYTKANPHRGKEARVIAASFLVDYLINENFSLVDCEPDGKFDPSVALKKFEDNIINREIK